MSIGAMLMGPVLMDLVLMRFGHHRFHVNRVKVDGVRCSLDGPIQCQLDYLGCLGIIYGSRLWLGSLLIGLIGFVIGGVLGLLFDKAIGRRWKRTPTIKHIDILLLIRWDTREHAEQVMDICRSNHAVSIGTHP
jgi:hypothetical protein